jgi:hypothetical protein
MRAFIVPLFIFLGAFGCPAHSFVTIYTTPTLDPTTLPDPGPDTTTITPWATVPYGSQVTPWTSSLAGSEVESWQDIFSLFTPDSSPPPEVTPDTPTITTVSLSIDWPEFNWPSAFSGVDGSLSWVYVSPEATAIDGSLIYVSPEVTTVF